MDTLPLRFATARFSKLAFPITNNVCFTSEAVKGRIRAALLAMFEVERGKTRQSQICQRRLRIAIRAPALAQLSSPSKLRQISQVERLHTSHHIQFRAPHNISGQHHVNHQDLPRHSLQTRWRPTDQDLCHLAQRAQLPTGQIPR